MSIEKAKEFLLALKEKGADEAWAAKAAEAKTEEEKNALAVQMAKEAGFDVTAEEIKEALKGLEQEGNDLSPLEDAEVESVAGGAAGLFDRRVLTECPNCERTAFAEYLGEETWLLFYTVKVYRCEACGQKFYTR